MQTNVELLKGISYENKTANEMIARLAEQSSKDSRTLKALTVIATMYLPASLLAVSSSWILGGIAV